MGKRTVNKVRRQRHEKTGPEWWHHSLTCCFPMSEQLGLYRKGNKYLGLFPFNPVKDTLTKNKVG